MRTLAEIIEAAQANETLEVEEARYALCALVALNSFDQRGISSVAEGERAGKKPFLATSAVYQEKESYQRRHLAFNKSPKDYCGEDYDPANPEYQRRRQASRALWNRFVAR